MVSIVDRAPPRGIGLLHAAVLAGALTLFLATLLSDYAYWSSHQIQWSNFASWLIAGGLVFGACALAWATVDLFRGHRHGRRHVAYFVVLLATWVLGFINALVHAKDAWAMMPGGLVLSVVVTLLACAATWIGFSGYRAGGVA